MYRSTIYHSNLSDQSAREISVRIRVRLRVCTILAFLRRIRKMSTLSSANVTDVNLVLKERTHMRLCLNMLIFTHNLGNWLIGKPDWQTDEMWAAMVSWSSIVVFTTGAVRTGRTLPPNNLPPNMAAINLCWSEVPHYCWDCRVVIRVWNSS